MADSSNHFYYYLYNPQGDVIALADASTGKLAATYTYDAWGKCTVENATGFTVGTDNPFRYRGYYYDSESELYYLQSRYYDAETGRFINADAFATTDISTPLSTNMFAYCENNPVNGSDPDGDMVWWAAAALGSAAFEVASYLIGNAISGQKSTWAGAAKSALKGAVEGVAFGAIGKGIKAISNAAKAAKATKAAKAAEAAKAAKGAKQASAISNGACFVAGTAVLTESGYVAIEDIRPGDKVWSENPETGKKEKKEVVRTFVKETCELVHVSVNDEEIAATPEHPFYVVSKGWIKAGALHPGDVLSLQSGDIAVVGVILIERLVVPTKVYNFEVEGFHTYYVGGSSVLVHNSCVQSPIMSQRAAMRAAKRSVNIPMSQRPDSVSSIKMIGENGQTVFARMEVYGNQYIRNDMGGHMFQDGATMGRHYNAGVFDSLGREISNGLHFYY